MGIEAFLAAMTAETIGVGAAGIAEASGAASAAVSASQMAAMTAAGTGAAGLGAAGTAALQAGAGAAATAGVTSLLQPKIPGLPKPLPMPDPEAQNAARQKNIAEMMARSGRVSTIMTAPGGSGKLGG